VLVGTAVLVFVFRAVPGPGAGSTWWMIDQLGFDQQFLAELSLIGSVLTLAGLFVFRRFMAERSMAYIVGSLTVATTIIGAPVVGLYYGLHHWTAAHTGGFVDARMIVLIDTAIQSPLGQIAMVPMLAWIANSAPDRLKATFFAVMASFTNLALAAAQLGTKYLNQAFVVTREVRDASGAVTTPADYSQLGTLLVLTAVITFVVPMLAVGVGKTTGSRRAWGGEPRRGCRLARGQHDLGRARLGHLDVQAPGRGADLVEREVEHGVARDVRVAAHRNVDPDARADGCAAAAAAAEAAAAESKPDARAAAVGRGRLLDRLRPDDLVAGAQDHGVFQPIAVGVEVHAESVGEQHVIRGEVDTGRLGHGLERKGGARAPGQRERQREQACPQLHRIPPIRSVVDPRPAWPLSGG